MANNNQDYNISQVAKLKNNQLKIRNLFQFDERLYKRICGCSNVVGCEKYEHIETLEKKTIYKSSYLCELRFCPVCNYYRVKNISPQIVRILRELETQGKQFIFVTITVPNCSFFELRKTILKMNKAFNFLAKTKRFKDSFSHWIRTLEITFKKDEAHPHFHCIFAVDDAYFNNKITTSELQKRFASVYKSDLTICDMRGIKENKKGHDKIYSAVAELSKYVIKSADLRNLNIKKMEIIYNELKRLNFIVTSRNLSIKENEEQKLDLELWRLIEIIVFQWNNQRKNYFQKRIITP